MMARDTLFDLAVNRALSYAKGLNLPLHNKVELKTRLEVWYLKTRFAYRVSLDDIVDVLTTYSGQGSWSGGKGGEWYEEDTF
jgi:hypothetical protein